MPATGSLSRHDRAIMEGLTQEGRITRLESDADVADEERDVLAKAINRLTWAIGAGLFSIVVVLLGAVLAR